MADVPTGEMPQLQSGMGYDPSSNQQLAMVARKNFPARAVVPGARLGTRN